MNLTEAVKIGKPFKRSHWMNCLEMKEYEEDGVAHTVATFFETPIGNEYIFGKTDLLAEDWEVPEDAKKISWPIFIADRNCPTWSRLTWWDKLLRRKPSRVAFKMPDNTIIVSAETKEHYEKTKEWLVSYKDKFR